VIVSRLSIPRARSVLSAQPFAGHAKTPHGSRDITVREVAVSDASGQRCFVRDEVSGSTGGIEDGESTFSQRQSNVAGTTCTVDTVSLYEERVHGGSRGPGQD
jgi:hypothetical protein